MKEYRIGKEIHRLDNHILRALEKICPPDKVREVTSTNGRIIRFLADNEDKPIYQKDLEKEFGITRSTASRVLMLMEQKGLVTRHGVDHDARLKQVVLTDVSRAFSQEVGSLCSSIDERLLKGFSQEETEQLRSFLARMEANLR